jgi:hypothetical protein
MTADKSNAFDLGQNLDEEMANIFGDMLGAS